MLKIIFLITISLFLYKIITDVVIRMITCRKSGFIIEIFRRFFIILLINERIFLNICIRITCNLKNNFFDGNGQDFYETYSRAN